MTNSPNTLNQKTIDWELGLKLAGGRKELAVEMIAMLVAELPENRQEIAHAYDIKDFKQLQMLVHKLHGGTCYCGVPKLKAAAAELENALKARQLANIDTLVMQLDQALVDVLEAAAQEIR